MTKCKRCDEESVIESRGEPFCKTCFVRFVRHRQMKQMEGFKVNYKSDQERHVCLALSMGPSSVGLLDAVVETLRKQLTFHTGKRAFFLHAVVVDERGIKGEMDKDLEKAVDVLAADYPEADFKIIPMSQTVQGNEIKISNEGQASSVFDAMKNMSRTSRQDAATALKYQLISNYAKENKMECVLYGHTQTRLAELVIASTAKGRGSSVPQFVDEYLYPFREVLHNEVESYITVLGLDKYLSSFVARVPGTTKLQSIDELVKQYFKSVEREYPSVVSTVVRTASKLAPCHTTNQCAVCGGPMETDTLDWIQKITVHAPTQDQSSVLCYGCVVMFRNSAGSITWPRYTTQDVLDECEL